MKIYNSLDRQKQEFVPIEKNKIKMYVCGQTVYDYCHLGHARKEIVFDMIRRWFIASGYEVLFVENITDIDDKIINRAIENKETTEELTKRFIQYMWDDFAKLGLMRPDLEPKATEFIPQMLNIIENLIEKEYAYQASNGDVYYSVRKFANYGQLSGKSLDNLRAGERVNIDKHKKDPMDFVLWKSSKENEPFWPSKFGNGRPGWHIECSAMSESILGKNFDIHGGGQDLQFPHHENEIAQSEAHNNCKFANYWLHNGFLNINEEKMSKSTGNFFTLREIFQEYDPEVIRFFMLKTHYRSPLNFSHEGLNESKQNLTKLYMALNSIKIDELKEYAINWNDKEAKLFKQAMDDDFNTPLAISVLFELVTDIHKNNSSESMKLLGSLANTIGLLNRNAKDFLQSGTEFSVDKIEEMIKERQIAKSNKDFKLSDQIRDELLNSGILLEDSASGTTWRKK